MKEVVKILYVFILLFINLNLVAQTENNSISSVTVNYSLGVSGITPNSLTSQWLKDNVQLGSSHRIDFFLAANKKSKFDFGIGVKNFAIRTEHELTWEEFHHFYQLYYLTTSFGWKNEIQLTSTLKFVPSCYLGLDFFLFQVVKTKTYNNYEGRSESVDVYVDRARDFIMPISIHPKLTLEKEISNTYEWIVGLTGEREVLLLAKKKRIPWKWYSLGVVFGLSKNF